VIAAAPSARLISRLSHRGAALLKGRFLVESEAPELTTNGKRKAKIAAAVLLAAILMACSRTSSFSPKCGESGTQWMPSKK
jgi:transcription initiation factor TFIIIB Brf1 subunit/transcription initiation factor TFIIB